MPLLTSPIDGSPMKQINRYGIEIDVCPSSGGIWMDRGELEKLMAFLKEEAVNDNPPYDWEDRRDYDDDDDSHRHRHQKKSKMSRMMDIFDF